MDDVGNAVEAGDDVVLAGGHVLELVGSVVAGHDRAPQLKDGDGHAVYRLSRVFQGDHTADRPGRPGLSQGRDLKQTCRHERSYKYEYNQMAPDKHALSSIKI